MTAIDVKQPKNQTAESTKPTMSSKHLKVDLAPQKTSRRAASRTRSRSPQPSTVGSDSSTPRDSNRNPAEGSSRNRRRATFDENALFADRILQQEIDNMEGSDGEESLLEFQPSPRNMLVRAERRGSYMPIVPKAGRKKSADASTQAPDSPRGFVGDVTVDFSSLCL